MHIVSNGDKRNSKMGKRRGPGTHSLTHCVFTSVQESLTAQPADSVLVCSNGPVLCSLTGLRGKGIRPWGWDSLSPGPSPSPVAFWKVHPEPHSTRLLQPPLPWRQRVCLRGDSGRRTRQASRKPAAQDRVCGPRLYRY